MMWTQIADSTTGEKDSRTAALQVPARKRESERRDARTGPAACTQAREAKPACARKKTKGRRRRAFREVLPQQSRGVFGVVGQDDAGSGAADSIMAYSPETW